MTPGDWDKRCKDCFKEDRKVKGAAAVAPNASGSELESDDEPVSGSGSSTSKASDDEMKNEDELFEEEFGEIPLTQTQGITERQSSPSKACQHLV